MAAIDRTFARIDASLDAIRAELIALRSEITGLRADFNRLQDRLIQIGFGLVGVLIASMTALVIALA